MLGTALTKTGPVTAICVSGVPHFRRPSLLGAHRPVRPVSAGERPTGSSEFAGDGDRDDRAPLAALIVWALPEAVQAVVVPARSSC